MNQSEESIPVTQNSIKDAVTKEMKEWLFKLSTRHHVHIEDKSITMGYNDVL